MQRFMKICLCILLVLNFLDILLTIYAIENGLGVEQNPLMLILLKYGHFYFVVGKITLVGFCVWVLWRLIYNRCAQVGTIFGITAYIGVVCWHIYGLML